MTPDNIRDIVTFCSEEVRRQHQGPAWVGYMVDAWLFQMDYVNIPMITVEQIGEIGRRIEPNVNSRTGSSLISGFRDYPVSIGGETLPLIRRTDVVRSLEHLVDAINERRVDAQTAYEEFELIHPFGDGNGRTGKILFNWMNGTMWKPVFPENRRGWFIP